MAKQIREIIDLYDIDRIPTGETAVRGERLPDKNYRLVIHVCIFNSKGEMLIQHRQSDIVRWPGFWDVSVGGGASAGDNSSRAAEREVMEELGLEMDFSDVRPMITVNISEGFDDFYTVNMDVDPDSLHLQEEEVSEARWASLAEIERMIDDGSFIPYEKNLMRYLFFTAEHRGTWTIKDEDSIKR